jgi:HK97 gp10 family phage protein
MSGIEVEGANEIAFAFDSIGSRLLQEIATALQDAASTIVNDAQANAPVKTGNLRDNIQISETSDTGITILSNADYSGFVEFGTRYMDAQPFFQPAFDRGVVEIQRRVSDAVERSLR